MNATLQAVEPTEPDPVADAIAALTAAARQTRVRGAGTDQATVEPVDFGEIACHVITRVAANLGGVDALLAGRPGSWEADYVRQIVQSTAGDDPDELLRWRTEPVRLPFDVEDEFYDFGLGDLYDQDRDSAADATFVEGLSDDQAAAAESIVDAIEALWEQDKVAYTAAYLAAARRYLTDRGATVDVELAAPIAGAAATWDDLTDQMQQYARSHTPLPATGAIPDYSDGTPADALRRAGLAYIDRARQA
ncbi:hypothetical protein [Leifsonia shinshuensis]